MSASRSELETRAKLRESLIFGDSNPDTTLLAEQAQEAVDKMLEAYTLETLKGYCYDLFQFISRQSLEFDIRGFRGNDCYSYGVRLFEKVEGKKVEVSSFTISFYDVEPINLLCISDFCAEMFMISHKEHEYDGLYKSEGKELLNAVVDDYIAFKGY